MIQIKDKKDCCGCSACVSICPKHCIAMCEDEEGFLYPDVDKSVCIDCQLCEKICPMLQERAASPNLLEYAAKNSDLAERLQSSSGGLFILFAKEVIRQNGVVFGAVFNEKNGVEIVSSETIEGVFPMMGSKYLQAQIGNSYKLAERFLKEGRLVLFTGTPCQISGLKSFLKKKYVSQLLAIDILCHGVPSPKVWHKYLSEHTSADKVCIDFRNKKINGWKQYCIVVKEVDKELADGKVVISDIHYKNQYFRGMLANLYLRPSCYNCMYKMGASKSDISIGDFWGIEKLIPEFDDDKGISLVQIHTQNGVSFFESLSLEKKLISYYDMPNGGLQANLDLPKQRLLFFKLFSKEKSVNLLVKQLLRPSLVQRIKYIVLKRVGKWISIE